MLGALGVIILALLAYELFLKADPEIGMGPTGGVLGADLIQISQNLSRVNLDPTLLSTPAYEALTDFSVVVAPQPVGRPNPFNIIGRD